MANSTTILSTNIAFMNISLPPLLVAVNKITLNDYTTFRYYLNMFTKKKVSIMLILDYKFLNKKYFYLKLVLVKLLTNLANTRLQQLNEYFCTQSGY